MSMKQEFEETAEAVKGLTKRPTDEELLELYALFKQATVGDIDIPKPGMFNMKGVAKWNAWNSKAGYSIYEAQEAYIKYAKGLIEKYK